MGVQDMLRIIVARADIMFSHVLTWPWNRIGISLLLAVIAIKVGKAFREERERDTDERGADSEDS